uniref:DnaJ (Hsp40) homolog, subfamily C, member 24 n=2 Tax=Gasterosteus aculeatus TaxID=69293 RepID=A0AAQ4RLU8_GASAC|nr:dnaJ homolog subfamily C member 24 isoform X1 [Gasterosteus aculeatus aculeatus]XP_040019223.1 dnaJ homolog subfamily C member 24 isoform X1 [Gasterosteus aculeatus aculeatus]XP_040019224.1 dnaJ homolog subfamily C member 24 isoform X1 [Gasterosteus aculeatus aculeatus]
MGDAAEQDLYAVLGAGPSDSAQQLRHRYQRLALQYHPDRHAGSSSAEAESGMKRFLEVDAAWRVLGDQTTRRQYDLQRRAQELKQDWPVDSVVHLQDMIWEQNERVYTHGCRCGGGFHVSEEEVQEVTRSRRQDGDEEEEAETGEREHGGGGGGVVVCCDTCSLAVCVTR